MQLCHDASHPSRDASHPSRDMLRRSLHAPPPSAPSRDALLDLETCEECHPKHDREWQGSMHASMPPMTRTFAP